jgi:hypothetical protein
LHLECNDAMQCGFSAQDGRNPDQDRRRENHCMQGTRPWMANAGTAAPGAEEIGGKADSVKVCAGDRQAWGCAAQKSAMSS